MLLFHAPNVAYTWAVFTLLHLTSSVSFGKTKIMLCDCLVHSTEHMKPQSCVPICFAFKVVGQSSIWFTAAPQRSIIAQRLFSRSARQPLLVYFYFCSTSLLFFCLFFFFLSFLLVIVPTGPVCWTLILIGGIRFSFYICVLESLTLTSDPALSYTVKISATCVLFTLLWLTSVSVWFVRWQFSDLFQLFVVAHIFVFSKIWHLLILEVFFFHLMIETQNDYERTALNSNHSSPTRTCWFPFCLVLVIVSHILQIFHIL